ncbi:MAG: hypothetical protein WCC87_17910 [Candidatus Korobacteraceae bacterium]
MEIYADLKITGEDNLEQFLESLGDTLPEGWSRNHKAEAGLSVPPKWRQYCFHCDSRAGRIAGDVWVSCSLQEGAYVSNVLPGGETGLSSLTPAQYHEILESFRDEVLLPVTRGKHLQVYLGDYTVDIEHWLSEDSAKLLRGFSRLANKSTGSSHPLDRKRWLDFVITAHREHSTLHADELGRWLVESEGWTDDMAEHLAVQYQFGRDLLQQLNNE